MKKAKIISAVAITLTLAAISPACSLLDVVGTQSISSFEEVLKAIPDNVQADGENAGWSLAAPDNSARFIWSEDYGSSPLYDVMLEFDAQPFLNAGLEPDRLPENYYFYENIETDGASSYTLTVGIKLGDSDKVDGTPTALSAYELIVGNYRDYINYHAELDHYGVILGDGNMFEWAKDLDTNGTTGENQELDIVFVLNPEPLIEAGVEPDDVEGWSYAAVEMMENGKTVEVLKFLKPFDLK